MESTTKNGLDSSRVFVNECNNSSIRMKSEELVSPGNAMLRSRTNLGYDARAQVSQKEMPQSFRNLFHSKIHSYGSWVLFNFSYKL